MSTTKRLEDVMKNLQTTAEVSRQSQKINLPQVNPLTGEAWTPTPEQYKQGETYADVQNRIGNASQRLSYVGEDPTKITDTRNPIEKGLNLPEGQNAIFDVFEMLQRGQQAMFAMIAPPKVSEGMGSYQKWAQDNRKRLKDSGLLDDSPMITDKDGKQRIREIHETSAYKQYLKEGGTPATETGLSEDPWKNMRDKIDEASDILGGKSQLYGGELIRRWMNVTDQDKAKEDGTLDWTDFAGFYLDMAFLDPGDVALPVFKVLGKRSKLTEKGVDVVKESAKQSGIKLTKEGIKTALVKKGAPGRVKDAKKFVNTLKEVSQITFKAGDTARVVKEGGVSLNRFIWHKAIDTTVQGAKLGNNVAIKMMSAVDPTIAKSYQNFLGHTMDTLGRGGKQLNQIVSKAINNKRRLAVALDFESKQFDKFFQETYEQLDLSEIKTQLSRIDVDKLKNFDELSPKLQDLFLDDTVFDKFKEAFLKMDDITKLDDVLKESMKRSLFKHTVNYREFMELARRGMKGYDFVDYMINDSKKVLNYTPEGEVLFRSIFDDYDDIVKVVDAENGLKMFKFDEEFFGEGNRKVLEDIIATRTVQIGETSIDSFSRNQIQSINRALKKLDIDPKTATPAQRRATFVSLKQPARISYLLEQAKEFNNFHLFVKEYAKEIEMIVGFQNDANIVGVKNFMKSLQEMGDIEGYADVRLAVFDILSEFSPRTLATKAEMLGIDISSVHKYMDDVMPKPPELSPIKTAKSVFEAKPKVSKVVSPEDMGNTIKPDDMIFNKGVIKTKFDPNVDGVNYRVFETTNLNSDTSAAILSDGKILSAKDHSQIAKAITDGSADFYVDTFADQGVIYYSRAQGDVADGLTLMVEPTQVQLDSIEKAIKSTKRKSKNGLRVFVELPGDKEATIIHFSAEQMKSSNAGKMVTDKIKEKFVGRVPFTKVTKVLEENTVALSTAQKKILKLKKSEKLGKMGDELVASVEKKASEMGLVKLSPEEAQTVIQKTVDNMSTSNVNGDITEMVKLSDILPFTEFNRIDSPFGDVVKLAEDVKLNGFQEPILLRVNPETGFAYIGEGNHRLAVAVSLGLDEIPVVVSRAKGIEPSKRSGGWFIDNTLIPTRTTAGTKYFMFDYAKPSLVGIEGRPIGLASKVPTATTKPGLKLNKEVAQRLSEAQEFEQYALKEIKEFANKLLDYKITIGGQEIKLVDFLGEESKEFIMDATDGGKKNVIQAFRQMAETNPALKAFLDDQTWADLMGKQEFDILTGTSIIPKSSKPIFSLPAPNFYTPKDLEYFKKLSTNSTVKELSRKYGETITKMQGHIGRIEFGDPQALVKASMRGYTPHVMTKANKAGEDVMQTLDTIDEELLLREIKGMFKKAGLPQENADLFMFGRNKTLAGREFSMSAREANNVRNALLIESVQKSDAFEKLDPDAQMEITDYIKKGLFSEDASDTLVAMTTKKMTAINYGNKNIQILAQMSFGDVDNQYVQFVLGNKKPKQAGMEALSDPQLRQVIKSLNTMVDVTGGDEYTEKLLRMFKKASTKQGTIYMDKHLVKQMVVGASKDAPAFLEFIDTFNGYFKAGKTLSPMFNVQNIIGNWSNMWFSGMKTGDIAKGYGLAVSDYHKFKKILAEVTDLKTLETALEGADKKLFDEIMYFMDNGFFTGNTALELQDVQKMLNQMDNAKGVKALVKKASDATGMTKISEANMNINLFNDNINRLTLFRHAKNNPEFIKSLGLKLTGDSNADAMNAVRFVLFDPNDLSFFEQDYMKRLIPFYTFQRQNLAFQTQNFVRKSDRYYKVWKTYEGAWNEKGMETNDLMQYEQDRMVLPIPYLGKDGQYTALRVSIPFVDALGFMSISGAFNRVISSTTPLVRAPYESASGVSTFTGEPIERYKDEQSKNIPFLTKGQEWALGQTGLDVPMRVATHGVLGVANAVTGNSEELGQNISKATGVVGAPRTVIQNEIAKGYEKLEQLDNLIKKVKETKDVPTITQIQKLSTNNKYDDMIQQQKRLSDLINGLKR